MKVRHSAHKFLSRFLMIVLAFALVPAAQANSRLVPIYAADGRIAMVAPADVATYTAMGWSAEPVELAIEDRGKDGTIEWEYGLGCLRIGGKGTAENYRYHSSNRNGGWTSHKDSIYTLYLKRGVSLSEFSFDEYKALSRVELPDTMTEIPHYAFSNCNLSRIGIPSSVVSLSGYSFDTYELRSQQSANRNMVIYCSKDSAAERFAQNNGLAYVYATQVFAADGRTCMVTDEELPAYLGSGWYQYPVTIVYSSDGSSVLIAANELSFYEASGWSADKYSLYTTMYALDGRQVDILNSQVADYQAVGWYLLPDYICAAIDNIIAEAGYTQAGYAIGVELLEEAMATTGGEADSRYWTFFSKRNTLCAAWQKAIGSPIAISGNTITHNSIGIPEVNIQFRNLTMVDVVSFEVKFTCIDAYGNATSDWSHRNGTFAGYMDSDTIPAYGTEVYTWTMYSNERTTSIRNARILRAAFADGSTWG